MTKHTVIVNPKAGNIFQRKKLSRYISIFKLQKNCDVHITQSKDHAQSIAKVAYKNKCRSFLIFGGDGTIFDIVNALYPKAFKDPPSFGLFPYGSGNSMSLDFAKDAKGTFDAIAKQSTKPCDVMELHTQDGTYYFTNLVSMGYVGEVAQCRNQYFNGLGPLGYILAVLVTLPFMKHKSLLLALDGDFLDQTWSFLSFNNTRFTGGKMMMAPHAKPDDGKIASLLVGPKTRLDILKAFPKIFTGQHIHLPQVATYQAQSVSFENALVQPMVIDGEIVEDIPIKLSIHPSTLHVYA